VSPARPDIDTARALVAGVLKPETLQHSERTAVTAARLARIHGVDEAAAELAGLLHDRAKDLKGAEVVALADELGLGLEPLERAKPRLMHAAVGALLVARELPGVDDAVLGAIERHTFGDPAMSRLDAVVYLADMIEPHRVYDGVSELRTLAFEGDLRTATRAGLARTIAHVVLRGRPLHPLTVHAYDAFVDPEVTW
jgi:predicted HD superfamily hydrolase involved in NAD metabolism